MARSYPTTDVLAEMAQILVLGTGASRGAGLAPGRRRSSYRRRLRPSSRRSCSPAVPLSGTDLPPLPGRASRPRGSLPRRVDRRDHGDGVAQESARARGAAAPRRLRVTGRPCVAQRAADGRAGRAVSKRSRSKRRRFARRGAGSSTRRTPSADASSATSTTARSSISSRSWCNSRVARTLARRDPAARAGNGAEPATHRRGSTRDARRSRAGHPSADPHHARTRDGASPAGGESGRPRVGGGRGRRPLPDRGRSRGLLRLPRGVEQRGQARSGIERRGPHRRARRTPSSSRCATTAADSIPRSAAPDRGSATWSTASRRSEARSTSRRRRAAAPWSPGRVPLSTNGRAA